MQFYYLDLKRNIFVLFLLDLSLQQIAVQFRKSFSFIIIPRSLYLFSTSFVSYIASTTECM